MQVSIKINLKSSNNMKPSKELIAAAETVFMAMAYTGTVREVVEAYQREILEKHQFKIADKWVEKMKGRKGYEVENRVITDLRETYLMSEEDSTIYFAELKKEQDKNGWHENSIKGTCPLLCAESLEREAKRELLRAAKYITGIDDDKQYIPMDKRDQLIELTLKLCAPFIDSKKVLQKFAA